MKQEKSLAGIVLMMLLIICGCSSPKKSTGGVLSPAPVDTVVLAPAPPQTDTFMERLLQTATVAFTDILKNRKAYKVEIIYTQIDRQGDNTPIFKAWNFNLDSAGYFYPASTVKMPVAFLALQKLHELSLSGLDKNSTLITEAAYSGQTPVYNEPTAKDGRPTIAQYIKKIFLVSDNDAFNRLYEFLGQQYINEQLHKMGYANAEILHRLQISLSTDANRHTNPIAMYDATGKMLYTQPMQFNEAVYNHRNDSADNAYYNNGELVNHPMNFSAKNRISLQDLTDILKAVLFPQSVEPSKRFNFNAEDYDFVKKYMSAWPTEADVLPYNTDTTAFWPAYGKYLLYGAEKGPVMPNVRIFNKIGGAYGFLTDVAYVADFEHQVEFMLSARIYCNSDGILNDDKYDYETIGFPFMKQLGQLLYNYELQRPRAHKPDLRAFKINYDR